MAKRYIKIADFQDKPSVLGPLSAARLNAINAGLDAVDIYKVDVDQIVHATAVNDTAKIPSSAVTYGLAQSIVGLNENLGNLIYKSITDTSTADAYLALQNQWPSLPAGKIIILSITTSASTYAALIQKHGLPNYGAAIIFGYGLSALAYKTLLNGVWS